MKKIIPVLCVCGKCGLRVHVDKAFLEKGLFKCPKCSGQVEIKI